MSNIISMIRNEFNFSVLFNFEPDICQIKKGTLHRQNYNSIYAFCVNSEF